MLGTGCAPLCSPQPPPVPLAVGPLAAPSVVAWPGFGIKCERSVIFGVSPPLLLKMRLRGMLVALYLGQIITWSRGMEERHFSGSGSFLLLNLKNILEGS